MHNIASIFKKEMQSLLRDRKALITLFLPVLIYPVMLLMFFGVMQLVNDNLSSQKLTLVVDAAIDEKFTKELDADKQIEVVKSAVTPESVGTKSWDDGPMAYLGLKEGTDQYVLYYHSSFEDSENLRKLVESIYRTYQEDGRKEVLKSLDLVKGFESAVVITDADVSGQGTSRVISMVIGLIAPFLVVLYGIMGAFTLSSDISAGEKERFTLETIFSVPVKRSEIMIGKLFACVAVGLLSGAINLVSMAPVIFAVSFAIPDLQLHLTLWMFIYLFIQLIPIMIIASALFMSVGFVARTYQEAQSYGSLALIALMMPCYIAIIPTLEGSSAMNFLPITNAMLLMREMFLGTFNMGATALTLALNLGVAALLIAAMQWLFSNDNIMFGGGQS